MNIHRIKKERTRKIITLKCLTLVLGVSILGIFLIWIHVAFSLSQSSSNQFHHHDKASPSSATTAGKGSTNHFPYSSKRKNQSALAASSITENQIRQDSLSGHGISPVKLTLPTPVFVVGYPKSGTTSVWTFFNCSGVVSQHYCCCNDENQHPPCESKSSMAKCIIMNMRQNKSMLEGCGHYDVYAQMDGERWTKKLHNRVFELPLENGTSELIDNKVMRPIGQEMRHFLPQHFLLHQLHRDYPNATFILPLRNSTQWVNSAMNWFNMRGRLVNEYRAQNPTMPRPGRSGAADWLKRIYEEHSQYVRDFVQKYPSHTLIEFHIHQQDAGEILGNAFGLSPKCWGHHNKMGDRAKFDYPSNQ